jgi:uncharacterized protein
MHVASPVRFELGELTFTWDPAKAAANSDKHGIPFEEAATTWLDPVAIERVDDAHSDQEDRWIRIGASFRGALLVVWSTERQRRGRPMIRIIGARRANRRERRLHDETNEPSEES